MWSYSLTAEEEALAVKLGYKRQLPFFGDPTRNINYSEGDLWETWQHSVAVGSEIALARMLGNTDFVPSVNTYKSRQDIDGVAEVRYTFNDKRGLRFTKRDTDKSKYVLMTQGIALKVRRKAPDFASPPYIAVGWMYGFECKSNHWNYNDNTWYVPMDQLHDMDIFNG